VVFYWVYLARHLCSCFDADPSLRPQVPSDPNRDTESEYHIALSKSQETQIQEIFDLFDTDGGGTIDSGELKFAMVSLGFYSKKAKSAEDSSALHSIIDDGAVTLEEFSALMMGELNDHDPKHMLKAVFTVLSRSDGDSRNDNLITSRKLKLVCRQFQVLPSIRKFGQR
jgi:Ca2+-binding EF-hand superfamily protein